MVKVNVTGYYIKFSEERTVKVGVSRNMLNITRYIELSCSMFNLP
jgi:hypothetical protein